MRRGKECSPGARLVRSSQRTTGCSCANGPGEYAWPSERNPRKSSLFVSTPAQGERQLLRSVRPPRALAEFLSAAMAGPRLIERLDSAIASATEPLQREYLRAERAGAIARLGLL